MADHWIQGAIKHPGVFRASAKAAGAINPDGTIAQWFIDKMEKQGSPERQKQAQLADTLRRLNK